MKVVNALKIFRVEAGPKVVISSSQNYHFSVMAEPTCQGDRKWMRKEAVMIDAPKEIEEKEGLPPIMVLKGEV